MEKKRAIDLRAEDFRFYQTIYGVKEVLCKEDLEDGLEPDIFNFDVAISEHADIQRIARNDQRRGIKIHHDHIYALIENFGHRLFKVNNGMDFSIIDSRLGIGIVCTMHQNYPNNVIVVKTVLNNEKIYVTRGTETLNMADGKMYQGF